MTFSGIGYHQHGENAGVELHGDSRRDPLSTRSTSEPEVVKGMRASMGQRSHTLFGSLTRVVPTIWAPRA
jgi:hypothetical protein